MGAIKRMPLNKASDPDSITVEFYRGAWQVIKYDVTLAISTFGIGDYRGLSCALITLLPKMEGAASASDFRPISLIHSVGKLITKALALCLAPRLSYMINNSPSAFIAGRSIHDNFKVVHSTVRLFKKTKRHKVLFKLDIAKAFDSVSWPLLLEVL